MKGKEMEINTKIKISCSEKLGAALKIDENTILMAYIKDGKIIIDPISEEIDMEESGDDLTYEDGLVEGYKEGYMAGYDDGYDRVYAHRAVPVYRHSVIRRSSGINDCGIDCDFNCDRCKFSKR